MSVRYTSANFARMMAERPSREEKVVPHIQMRIKDIDPREAQHILNCLGIQDRIPWRR